MYFSVPIKMFTVFSVGVPQYPPFPYVNDSNFISIIILIFIKILYF